MYYYSFCFPITDRGAFWPIPVSEVRQKQAKACLSFIYVYVFTIKKSFNNPNQMNVYITTNKALDCNLSPPSSLISPSSVILFDMDIM